MQTCQPECDFSGRMEIPAEVLQSFKKQSQQIVSVSVQGLRLSSCFPGLI